MKVKIVGVKKGKNKAGKDCFTIFFERPFSNYDEENAECSGCAVGNEFTYRDFGVRPDDIVDIAYEPGYEGKATLSDITMIKPHVAPADTKKS